MLIDRSASRSKKKCWHKPEKTAPTNSQGRLVEKKVVALLQVVYLPPIIDL
jgi:hypothetical protein